MARTLNATLQTAQDGQSHYPIFEIISSEAAADIPFDGVLLNNSTTSETFPHVVTHSTGALCLAYAYGNYLRYVFTDSDRTSYTVVDFSQAGLTDISVTELVNGNIGIAYRYLNGSTYYVRYRIVTLAGVAVSDTQLFTHANTVHHSGPFVLKLADDSYLMIYAKQSGSDYYIYKRTSSDFTTWSAESQLTIGGLTATWRLGNPCLMQLTIGAQSGSIWLWFDVLESTGANGEELTNIYFTASGDAVIWDDAVKATDYNDFTARAEKPIAIQKPNGEIIAVFTKVQSALKMNGSTTGWCGSFGPKQMHFDSTARLLYVGSSTGLSPSATEIDVDAWSVADCWSTVTSPGFEANQAMRRTYSAGHYVAVWYDQAPGIVGVLNAETNEVVYYTFWAAYGHTVNVGGDTFSGRVEYVKIDPDTNRMWLIFNQAGGDYWNSTSGIIYGYIDLTQASAPYTFVKVGQVSYSNSNVIISYCMDIANDLLLVSMNLQTAFFGNKGRLIIIKMTEQAIWKNYSETDYSTFPTYGVTGAIYHPLSNCVYCTFAYKNEYNQGGSRGLMQIDLNSDVINFQRPSWATLDEYSLRDMLIMNDGRIIMITFYYGVTIFNPVDLSWTLYDQTNIPDIGINPEFSLLAFDELNQMVFVANTRKLLQFPLTGELRQSFYMTGTYTG